MDDKEIALELVKLIAKPYEKKSEPDVDCDSKEIAKAYNTILQSISQSSNYQQKNNGE